VTLKRILAGDFRLLADGVVGPAVLNLFGLPSHSVGYLTARLARARRKLSAEVVPHAYVLDP